MSLKEEFATASVLYSDRFSDSCSSDDCDYYASPVESPTSIRPPGQYRGSKMVMNDKDKRIYNSLGSSSSPGGKVHTCSSVDSLLHADAYSHACICRAALCWLHPLHVCTYSNYVCMYIYRRRRNSKSNSFECMDRCSFRSWQWSQCYRASVYTTAYYFTPFNSCSQPTLR